MLATVRSGWEAEEDRIWGLIEGLGNGEGPGLKAPGVEQALRTKMRGAMERGEPLWFALPAFPAKSANRGKTLGSLPDWGERVALERLNTLCREIGEGYAPGARMLICSDGRVFSDLVGVEESDVGKYGEGIARLIESLGLEHLSTFCLEDEFKGCEGDAARQRLVQQFGVSLDQVRQRCRTELAQRAIYNGIHRFLFEDELPRHPERSRNWVRKETAERAFEVIQRSDAWSRLVEARFGSALRLSIHPQSPHSEKIPVRLVDSPDRWRTPWHAVPVDVGGKWELWTHADACARGATRELRDGLPCFVWGEA